MGRIICRNKETVYQRTLALRISKHELIGDLSIGSHNNDAESLLMIARKPVGEHRRITVRRICGTHKTDARSKQPAASLSGDFAHVIR